MKFPYFDFHLVRFVFATTAGLLLVSNLSGQITFTPQEIERPPSDYRESVGWSHDGTMRAGTTMFGNGASATYEAFRWPVGGTKEYLGLLPGRESTSVRGMSADGSVIVGTAENVEHGQRHLTEAFRWTEETGLMGLGYLPGGNRSRVNGISQNGEVIIGTGDGISGGGGFRWTESGGMELIGNGNPYGISDNGRYIVGEGGFAQPSQAFLWSEEAGMIGLGSLRVFPNGTAAGSVTSDGQLVLGWGYDKFFRSYGFMWTPESGMRGLVDVITNVYGIGDQIAGWNRMVGQVTPDGRYIYGSGFSPANQFQHWMLDLGTNPPEIPPGTNPPPMNAVPESSAYALISAIIALGLVVGRLVKRSRPAGKLISMPGHTA